MSQSPETAEAEESRDEYLSAFGELAQRIRDGASFSGRERHCAFLNTGQGVFADVSAVSGFGFPHDGRGMALTDWNRDGAPDLWLSNRTAPRVQLLLNRLPGEGAHWVALRLVGDPAQGCPRDAIGSQVEVVVAGGTGRRVKTLHAGNGLSSQSSKWLHFGLGDKPEVEAVRVRWAGGASEEFRGVTAGRRWHLRQGTGTPMADETEAPAPGLEARPLELPAPTEVARIRLSQPFKIPELAYTDFAGSRQTINALTESRAVLVNLWATWCLPCAAELKAFGAGREGLQREGLVVLALNVDHLGSGEAATPQEAAAALKRFGFAMPGGMASPELVDILNQAILESVYHHRTMPVPVSFLIDRGGWLSAIYKGPVELEQVIADRKALGKSPEAALAAAVPFPGTWATRFFVSNPMTQAAAHIEGGYLAEARAVLDQFIKENDVPPGDSADPAAQKRNMQLAGVYFQLAELSQLEGRQPEAKQFYQTSLRYNPRQIPALNDLAWMLATSADPAVRDPAEALRHAQFMMQAPGVSKNPALLGTLAAAHAAAGQFTEAASITKRIIALLDAGGQQEQAAIHRERLALFENGTALTLSDGPDPSR